MSLKFSQYTEQFMISTSNMWASSKNNKLQMSVNMAKHPSEATWIVKAVYLALLTVFIPFYVVTGHHLPPDLSTDTLPIHRTSLTISPFHCSPKNPCWKTEYHLPPDSVQCSHNNLLWCRRNRPSYSGPHSLSSLCWDRWMFSWVQAKFVAI